MNKTWIKTASLFALVVGLFAAYYLLGKRDAAREKTKEAQGRLFPWPLDDVEALAWQWRPAAAGKVPEYRIERAPTGAPDQWRFSRPSVLPADRDKVEAFVRALSQVQLGDVVASADAAGSDNPYGLKVGAQWLRLSLRNREERTLNVGDRHPLGGKRYVQIQGKPGVYLVDVASLNVLGKAEEAFVDHKIFHADPMSVKTLAYVKSGAEKPDWVVSKHEGKWRVTEPYDVSADSARVEEILTAFSSLEWKDEPPRLKTPNEAAPSGPHSYRFQITPPDLGSLIFSPDPSNPNRVFVWSDRSDFSYTLHLERAQRDILESDFAAVHTKTAFEFYPWQVLRVTWQSALESARESSGVSRDWKRDGSAWKAMAADGTPSRDVDVTAVGTCLESLTHLKINNFYPVTAQEWAEKRQAFLFDAPLLQGTIFLKDDAKPENAYSLSFFYTRDGERHYLVVFREAHTLNQVPEQFEIWEIDADLSELFHKVMP